MAAFFVCFRGMCVNFMQIKSKDPDQVKPGAHWDDFSIIQTV
jgi:hypothetical protein